MLYHAPGNCRQILCTVAGKCSLSTVTCLVGREPVALLTTLVRVSVFADQPQGGYGH